VSEKPNFIWIFPNVSIFSEAKDSDSRAQNKEKTHLFLFFVETHPIFGEARDMNK